MPSGKRQVISVMAKKTKNSNKNYCKFAYEECRGGCFFPYRCAKADGTENEVSSQGMLDNWSEDRLSRSSFPSDCASGQCDECDRPANKTIRDASGSRQFFCLQHWDEHVAFAGNDGKPYGF